MEHSGTDPGTMMLEAPLAETLSAANSEDDKAMLQSKVMGK